MSGADNIIQDLKKYLSELSPFAKVFCIYILIALLCGFWVDVLQFHSLISDSIDYISIIDIDHFFGSIVLIVLFILLFVYNIYIDFQSKLNQIFGFYSIYFINIVLLLFTIVLLFGFLDFVYYIRIYTHSISIAYTYYVYMLYILMGLGLNIYKFYKDINQISYSNIINNNSQNNFVPKRDTESFKGLFE